MGDIQPAERPEPSLRWAGLSLKDRRSKLECLLKTKIFDTTGRVGRNEAFRGLELVYKVKRGVDIITLRNKSKDLHVAKRISDGDGGWKEVPRWDKLFLIGPIRFFIASRADNFCKAIDENLPVGERAIADIRSFFYTWIDTLYEEYGLTEMDVVKPYMDSGNGNK